MLPDLGGTLPGGREEPQSSRSLQPPRASSMPSTFRAGGRQWQAVAWKGRGLGVVLDNDCNLLVFSSKLYPLISRWNPFKVFADGGEKKNTVLSLSWFFLQC